eukprot:CAMPEP_0197624568 /NCGR_PEP_ID=MMETSP1338-20131121/4151_1 /TAXON_ID=43686 ORGANISM="Pelagodinium beii, Strain RCC1491" /NCGR_SAMPLE_ID=MMETSP1338 /ASSEMBLY_ACC=CAM_ASM_000754 /LENGTH=631 /DNA_ID=CAMNT_0043194721 /DNA_START=105 /DNA_END=1997 /DNA_ORIENTATION=+
MSRLSLLAALALAAAEVEVELTSDGQILSNLEQDESLRASMVRRQEGSEPPAVNPRGREPAYSFPKALLEAIPQEVLDEKLKKATQSVEAVKAPGNLTEIFEDQSDIAVEALDRSMVAAAGTCLIFFYLASCKREALQVATMKVLHFAFAVFFVMLQLKVQKALWKLIAPDPNQDVKNLADALSIMRFLINLWGVHAALYFTIDSRPVLHSFIRSVGTASTAFTGADAISSILKYNPFSDNWQNYTGGVALLWLCLTSIEVASKFVRDRNESATEEEAAPLTEGAAEVSTREKWSMEVAEMEDEVSGFTVAFAISTIARFYILEVLPGAHHRDVKKDDATKLSELALGALLLAAIVAALQSASTLSNQKPSSMQRVGRTFSWLFGFSAIWLVYYAWQWQIWVEGVDKHSNKNLDSHPYMAASIGLGCAAQVAGGTTVLVALIMVVLYKAGGYTLTTEAFAKLAGLILGFAWYFFFYESIVASSVAYTSSSEKEWYIILSILKVMLTMAPAWIIWIMPAAAGFKALTDAYASEDGKAPADATAPGDAKALADATAPADAKAPVDAKSDTKAPADATAPADAKAPAEATAPADAKAPADAPAAQSELRSSGADETKAADPAKETPAAADAKEA